MSLESDAIVDRRRLKRRLSIWRLLAVVIGIALVVYASGSFVNVDGLGRAHVARLSVEGVIVEDPRLDAALEAVRNNDNARALLVHINSPGGSTYGGERLYQGLRRVAENKPVVAVIGTLGTSAGYMAAIAADRVFAGESSLTGSIGVLMQFAEFSELLETLGIRAEQLTSGPLKGEPSPVKPLSPLARVATQSLIDQTHEWFVGLVATRRPFDLATARRLANGQVFIGRGALQADLIDAIGGEREARDWLASEHDISTSLPSRGVSYLEPEAIVDRLVGKVTGKSFLTERLTLDGLVSVWHPDLPIVD
ncbi:signal peptide peptidase SppA [Oceanibacterium hippocampi]|uniref:Putative signal peptide peptidase SppA n=1 Tax=Oceanibacterium hippocampi TaxID=745714 RepID=A0A1Y5RPL5_9PROT|nr:signal peptide peptidase SppA [Oceanibacterium hippocampi]SLN22419.1 Putative signal peptide peptidase SppA [Oceanibacterium hippocampi]